MNKLQNKPSNEEEKKETGRFSWDVIILMISLVLVVLLIKFIIG